MGLRSIRTFWRNTFPGGVGKTIVPCILNSLPFAVPGGIDGVYVTDLSSFSRFFKDPRLGIASVEKESGTLKTRMRTKLASLWSGDRPTPDDLLRQVRWPIQFGMAVHHVEKRHSFALLGGTRAACIFDFGQEEMTAESALEAIEKFSALHDDYNESASV